MPDRFDRTLVWTGIVAREKDAQLWAIELPAPALGVTQLPTKAPSTSTADLAKLKDQPQKGAQDEKK